MAEPMIIQRVDDGVLYLLLNDANRRNPLSEPMIAALNEALTSSEAHSVGVVVLRGAGGFFSAGGDVRGFQESLTTNALEQLAATQEFRRLFSNLDALEALTVAVVEGQALGGGCGLAAAADVVIASENARFGCPEVHLGAFPMVITAPLVRAIGPRATLALAVGGKSINARRAKELGLVTEVFVEEGFEEQLRVYFAHLAQLPIHVLRLGKMSVRAAEMADYRSGLESGSALRSLLFATPEFHHGVNAFVEGRASKT